MLEANQLRFFLDSGAFSAWTKKTDVDLDEYITFIKLNIEFIDVYANLDVIPGELGRAATAKEKECAACDSYTNFMKMRAEGLDPLPVFHIGERWEWLEVYRDHGCDYIGLGGLVGVPSEQKRAWLDDVFDRICDAAGKPLIRTHGFGMTSIPLIFRYPWYSVDSTSWIKATANGAVLLPALRDGSFVFDEVPQVISVSDQSPNATKDGKHANTLMPAGAAALLRWLDVNAVTREQVADSYYHRAVCNVRFFVEVSKARQAHRFERPKNRRVSLWE